MLEHQSLVLRTSLELRWSEPELEAAAEPRDLWPALRPRIICQRCVRPEQHEDRSVTPLNMLTTQNVRFQILSLVPGLSATIAYRIRRRNCPVVPVATTAIP